MNAYNLFMLLSTDIYVKTIVLYCDLLC